MTVSNQLLSILAMDAYNQNYNDNRLIHGKTQIGAAALSMDSSVLTAGGQRLDIPAGFYAAAYSVGSEIVISYRGTDDGTDDVYNDALFASGSILGLPIPPQVLLAVQFYDAVKAANPTANIVLTGHSLGGALAGIVGSLRGEQAELFNNISFEMVAAEIRSRAVLDQDYRDDYYQGNTPPLINASQIMSHVVPGDVAGNLRGLQSAPKDTVGSQSFATNLDAVPDFFPTISNISPALWYQLYPLREINLHWQSFLIIKDFAEVNGHDPLWTYVYKPEDKRGRYPLCPDLENEKGSVPLFPLMAMGWN